MTDTKTAVERARDLAVPIMTEARRLRESNDLQWASWHAAIVEGIQQAITDTETRVRQEMSKIENVPDSVLLAKENIDAHSQTGGSGRNLRRWSRPRLKRLYCPSQRRHRRWLHLWAVRSGTCHVSDLIEGLLCADAQAALDQHVAAAVQKAREEWDREEQHGCCENLKKKIVEIANLKAQLAEANRNLGMLANCSIAIRERNAEIANLKARYDKALAGWQAERSDWQNDVKELNARLAAKAQRVNPQGQRS